MGKSQDKLAQLRATKEKVLRVAELQQHLRVALKTIKTDGELTIAGLAHKLDVEWSTVSQFLKGNQAICGGQTLSKILAYMERSRMAVNMADLRSIPELTDGWNERLRGITSATPQAIELMFDVHEALLPIAVDFTYERFAALFSPHEDVVVGLLVYRHEALAALETPEIYDAIYATLAGDRWERRVNRAREDHKRAVAERVARFVEVLERLRLRYNSYADVARKLGVHSTTLGNARKGTASMETFAELTRKAEAILDAPNATRATELVAELLTFLPSRQKLAEALKMGNRVRVRELERGLTSSKRTPTQKRYDAFFAAAEVFLERCRAGEVPQASATDKTEKVTEESADPESPPTKASTPARAKSLEIELTDGPTLAEVLAAFGGGPSPFGTNFALTSDVFREIDGDPGALGVEVARAAMRYARALLNIMTQVKDPKVRERVRKELGPEVEEMFHTLKLFSNENPTRLLPLYDAQRTTLAATTGNGGKAKKKRRR